MCSHERTLDHVQTDVDFANRFRIEYVKHMMSIAGGALVFSALGAVSGLRILARETHDQGV